MSTNPYLSIDQKIVGDIYTSNEIWDNLATLTDEFGSRFGGTEGEKLAAQFLQKTLESYGLTVTVEEIPYLGWRRGAAKLEVLSPIQKEIPCISLPHSPAANLEAVLVDMGDGAPEDFDTRAEELEGKIVLATSEVRPNGSKRWIHRNEKYGRSLLAGAVGFLFVNHYPGYGVVTGGIGEGEYAGHAPALGLSYEDGTYLQRLIKKHGEVKVRITSNDEIEPMISWNIIGELQGNKNANQIIMLGSHYDGHDISQGAGDPASGSVSVLEAARVLSKYAQDLPCTIRFALWGVEEIGLLGSHQYTKDHEAELDNIRFYLNLDSAGVLAQKDIELNMWDDLESIFENWSDEMNLPYKVKQSVNAFSDHYPFLLAGVPTGGVGNLSGRTTGRGYGHTRYDTLDKIEIRSLREAAALAARIALRVASQAEWPAQRRSQDAVAEVLDSPENREETEIFSKIVAFYETQNENS